jgi:RHH-type proline utilization regulon transcriptional repressor/proline dehydrogenase/delta 1-pyrroline-5-carboxylate dehydrogenase
MLDLRILSVPQGVRGRINQAYRAKESDIISFLSEQASLTEDQCAAVRKTAMHLVEQVRLLKKNSSGIDSFLTEYALSSEEGIALMCLAEALLRVPDKATIDRLIKDKLAGADWGAHSGQSDSFFINATTWALMLTGKMLSPERAKNEFSKVLFKLVNRSSEPVIRKAVDAAMRIMGKQFVMGRTIQEAMSRATKKEAEGYRYSYDMLGEAALTANDAERYLDAYSHAIESIGSKAREWPDIYQRPGISIKLSALHPRYQEAQRERVLRELAPKLLKLALLAKSYDIAMTIDAEESERLDLSLDVIEKVFTDEQLEGWHGFGMALQSYQKRAFYVLDWIAELARSKNRRMMVRLIKGAYWDSEIKKTQMQGLSDYPVFTRKVFTDVSFQACAKKILTMTDAIYPQFATHNAYSVALILQITGDYRDFEFQCLHGMGTELYEQIVPKSHWGIPCRLYAPVGSHEDLLPYLVRRLLENGANSSFVNRIVDDKAPVDDLIGDPVVKSAALIPKINHNIPLPSDIFLPERKNAPGVDFTDRACVAEFQHRLNTLMPFAWQNKQVAEASLNDIEKALISANTAFETWHKTPVQTRAESIRQFANLLLENQDTFLAMACLEAGKTWGDGVAEIREAVDFCLYYAAEAEKLMAQPMQFSGYTGEMNQLSLSGRGIVLCISPWNFPLAIFTGQVVAALVTGNCVIAKPAEQTPLIAQFAVELMHKAGVPAGVIQLLAGRGEVVGAALVADLRIKGVIFTGSTETAAHIYQALAKRGGEIIPLIAETGGQNAMIVDSSALLEQVTNDVLTSAFGSAGQRCSALRVLYVQAEVYPRFIELLKGAMAELVVGDPGLLNTDVGPVIDEPALFVLQRHVESMKKDAELIYQCSQPKARGYFMPPTAFAIKNIHQLKREVFGPVLHVIAYQRSELDSVLADINSTGYGLTLGIHSRVNETVAYIRERVHAGNCYVNRNMIGAVVGLQPFGGEGLSGTGPKAGGPFYLQRLCHERTFTVDTTAAGGNATLMASVEEG